MMDKQTLRKADIFTSFLIVLFGAWVIYQATGMPMKDSYGGVQNVWYVSPALFPLFVGTMLVVIGAVLFLVALKQAGLGAALEMLAEAFRRNEQGQIFSDSSQRFMGIGLIFIYFVYIYVPMVDFYISTLLFLAVFTMMFHLDDMAILRRLLALYSLGSLALLVFFASGLSQAMAGFYEFTGDILALILLLLVVAFGWILVKADLDLVRKYKVCLVISFVAPTFLCPVFKYFLLVPLPFEGMATELMEYIRYGDE